MQTPLLELHKTGLEDKCKTSKDITQYGDVKVNGSKSIIAKLKQVIGREDGMCRQVQVCSCDLLMRLITAEVENKCLWAV